MESLGIGRKILKIQKYPSYVKIKSCNVAQRKAVYIYNYTQKPQRRSKKLFPWLRNTGELSQLLLTDIVPRSDSQQQLHANPLRANTEV